MVKFTIVLVTQVKHLHLSFPQTDKPYYFPELKFQIHDILKGSNHVKLEPKAALKAHIEK